MPGKKAVSQTLKIDIARGALEGVLLSGFGGIFLLILIEIYLKPAGLKGEVAQSLLFGSSFLGMALSLFVPSLAANSNWKKTTWIIVPCIATGLGLLAASFSHNMWFYVASVFFAGLMSPLRLPFLTQIYHENYPDNRRATFHGLSLVATQLTTVVFGYLAGELLNWNPAYWPIITLVFSVSIFWQAFLIKKIPTKTSPVSRVKHPLGALRWLYKDKVFAYILAVWFIFGFANLWIFPIRISYLADARNLAPATVALLATVIPEATRMVFIPVWGFLFDRMNFIVLRILLNSFFVAGIWQYFHAESLFGIGVGSFLHGIGFAGGRLAWALWITKMVPQDRSAEYMAVHVSLTGLRGFIGPMIGFWALAEFSKIGNGYHAVSNVSAFLFFLTMILLVPIIKYGRR